MDTNMNNMIPNTPNDGCLDWGDTLQNDGQQFINPAEGDYLYQVVGFERGRHAGSAKLPPCNKATLTLEIQTPDGICHPLRRRVVRAAGGDAHDDPVPAGHAGEIEIAERLVAAHVHGDGPRPAEGRHPGVQPGVAGGRQHQSGAV